MQGSVWMGMGQALSEESQYHEGLSLRANLLDYRVPTIVESPPIETFIVEAPDPHGPFGAKEAGEGSLSGFLPALTNAIADATGLRLHELPASPDRLLAAIAARRRAEKLGRIAGNSIAQGGDLMERIAPFVLERPASLAEAVALLAATPGARPLAGGTDLLPNLRDGIGESPVLVDLGGIDGFSALTVERERTTIGAGVTLARIAIRCDDRRRAAGAGRGRSDRRRTRPSHRGNARRQPLPRHALRLLQPERVVAPRQRFLPEARRRCLPRRAAGQALPRGVFRRSRPGTARARRRRSRSSARPARGRLPLAELYLDDGARHLSLAPGEIVAAVRIPAQPASARSGVPQGTGARRHRFSARRRRRAGRDARRPSRRTARRADRHQRAAVPARRHACAHRRRGDRRNADASSASSCRSR